MEKRDYLYEYLMYFWKKKWLIIGIPVAVAILAYGLSIAVSKGYEGNSNFFTATLKSDYLTDPELLESVYQEKYGKKLKIEVLGQSKVEFSVKGKDKASVENLLNKASAEYIGELKNEYNSRLDLTENKLAAYEDRLKSVEKSYGVMSDKLQTDFENLNSEELTTLSDAIAKEEKLISDYDDSIQGMKTDILQFEKPLMQSKEVAKQDNNAKANAIVGFILGLFLTLLGLMLSKYIGDARRAEIHG
ncbi:hypothetical protein J9317_18345 [Metabacillus sp. KIGAM252]|uniref:Lipopolysaccharide biosynthesis protein n=1 Tax=Metabacillus flavus TaxID=2823519 RepID=A0ABS5LJ01_9BACI|nr:hypothetical protein [Metabacillus flavus]MBS2970707.1 hypothetical protein [Metabacillus flavus]